MKDGFLIDFSISVSFSQKNNKRVQLRLEVVFFAKQLDEQQGTFHHLKGDHLVISRDLAFTTSTHSPFGPFAKRVKY